MGGAMTQTSGNLNHCLHRLVQRDPVHAGGLHHSIATIFASRRSSQSASSVRSTVKLLNSPHRFVVAIR